MSKQELKTQLKQAIAQQIYLKEQLIELKEKHLKTVIAQQTIIAAQCNYCVYRHLN